MSKTNNMGVCVLVLFYRKRRKDAGGGGKGEILYCFIFVKARAFLEKDLLHYLMKQKKKKNILCFALFVCCFENKTKNGGSI